MKILDRINDWKIQIVQTLLPLIIAAIVLLLRVNIPLEIHKVTAKANVNDTDIDTIWRIAIGIGNIGIIILILFFVYKAIRKHNKDSVLVQSLPRRIVWHSYVGYWFCRWVLNYQTVSLTRVPIPVQFELVWHGLFKQYEFMDGISELSKGTDKIHVEKFNDKQYSTTVNLVLADTYPLDWKKQLMPNVRNLTTIVIDRAGEKGVRYYSPDFVSEISQGVHNLPETVTSINLFATINAAHCFHITEDIFKTGGRDALQHLFVYQQSGSGERNFEGKCIQVF